MGPARLLGVRRRRDRRREAAAGSAADRAATDRQRSGDHQEEAGDHDLVAKTKGQTVEFTATTQAYLDKLEIDKGKKAAVLIDLLDAIALATNDVEALGLIGSSDKRRKTWLQLARTSGDPGVRSTAMRALARTAARNPVEHITRIFEPSDDLNDADTGWRKTQWANTARLAGEMLSLRAARASG